MKYIQYAVARKDTGNATGKAKYDAFDIARRMGFLPSYHPSSIQKIRVIQQILTLYKFHGGGKVIFFQYPAVSNQLMDMFKKVITNDSYKIVLVHDITSIQGVDYKTDEKKELEFLNLFNCAIVHNDVMATYIKRMGYKGDVVVLELFDYLHSFEHPIIEEVFSNSVSFAGNMKKASFLHQLGEIHNVSFNLYGANTGYDFSTITNVTYKGLLPSDEIQYLMQGDYGLVWDGSSLDSCEGTNGEYLKYNNPHKLSLYIAAGKPVITWKNAAIAQFVEDNNIGITVNSLRELNEHDLSSDYLTMKRNVLKIKKQIAEGKYLERAIKRAMNFRSETV